LLERLKTLYELQLVDDQLDELEELRGDLPSAVQELESKINAIKSDISQKEQEQKEALTKREENETESEKLKSNQKKFKSQLYSVRNNKEYDALTKEIDHSDEIVTRLVAENDALADQSKKLSTQIEDLSPLLVDLEKELEEKNADLGEIIKANEKEEAKLREARAKIEVKAKKPDLSAYLRIRKAKKGKAVASLKRSACSGCHNIVPAQRQLELRRNSKLFFCEYCGRILVSSEIAEFFE
jgi:uncharacterized protein